MLRGRVLGIDCRPIPLAVLDFWQVDDLGRYDNVNYNYRGHQFTDSAGGFELRTILPKSYRFEGLWRAAHIHVKVQGKSTRLLNTQLFFPNDPVGNGRHIGFNDRLVVDLKESRAGCLEAFFDFVLETA